MRGKTAAFLRLDELAGGKLSEVIDTAAAVVGRFGFVAAYEMGKGRLSCLVGWEAPAHFPAELQTPAAYEVVIYELARRCERPPRRPHKRGRRRAGATPVVGATCALCTLGGGAVKKSRGGSGDNGAGQRARAPRIERFVKSKGEDAR